MSDELRAAAERLREHRRACAAMEHPRNSPYTYVEVSTGAAGFVPEAESKDMGAVITAYLAERPADDATPITKDWLESVGFWDFAPPNDLMVLRPATGGGGRWYVDCHLGEVPKLLLGGSLVATNPTIGHVRLLLRGLGVELPAPAVPTGTNQP